MAVQGSELWLNSDITDLAKEIKDKYPKLTDYESLSIALKIEANLILREAFVVKQNNKTPVALEAIAMALRHS
jgi:hypothetical protein